MIYLVKTGRNLTKEELCFLCDIADEKRIAKFEKQRNRKKAEAGLIGDVLVRLAIKKELGIDVKNISFAHGEKGKPFVAGYPDVHFNVSHSEDVVVCAVSKLPVGIDVEKIKAVKDSVIKRVCTVAEIERIKSAKNPDEEFIKLWTMKEAVVKKYATGIAEGDFKNCLAGEQVFSLRFEDYIISISE